MKQIQNTCLVLVVSGALVACSSLNILADSDAIDYKSSKPATKLDIPPDLTQLKTNDRFTQNGVISASVLSAANANEVLPVNANARIERSGGQRWMVVNMPAEKVYPIVTDFWKQLGFTLAVDSPQTGVIETDWAENRAKLPVDGLRKLIGGIFDNVFDSGERDKYRTRIDRVGNTTEIYISHRGTKEINASNSLKEPDFKTLSRNGNADLEAEFLRRLMLRFGTDEVKAKEAVTGKQATPDKARIKGTTLEMDDAFEMAWRRVGIALDRTGFTVDDKSFTDGIYYVRYARSVNDEDLPFFKRIFTNEKERLMASQKLRIVFNKAAKMSTLSVQSDTGDTASADIAQNVLQVLQQELR